MQSKSIIIIVHNMVCMGNVHNKLYMGGESWYTTKNLEAPFPDLKAGHVDHLLSYGIYIYQRIIHCVCVF